MELDLKKLFGKLNGHCYQAMDAAANACVGRGGSEVLVDDLLLQLIEAPDSDIPIIFRLFELELSDFRKALQEELEAQRSETTAKPVLSPQLVRLLQESWITASTQLGIDRIRAGVILLTLRNNPHWYQLKAWGELLHEIPAAELAQNLEKRLEGSDEDPVVEGDAARAGSPGGPPSEGDALKRFTTNFTEKAEAGRLDPVFCRDVEIRQMIDILSRRQKNNPILVGEPGVGKSAVVEGLARKIHEGDVPDSMKDCVVLGLDLGALQAGASVKGEFEKRLNGVINAVKQHQRPVILFIDEAHTLIGAGGAAGGGDAANLLKPALARGELRSVAATTWAEYRKYFEKDPALARRFQLVKLDEPTPEQAVVILRGLRSVYEKAHGVYVRDDAIEAAAELSARYITGRQLPDKAVDVLDTACARVNVGRRAKPHALDDLEKEAQMLAREKAARQRDIDNHIGVDPKLLDPIDERLNDIVELKLALEKRWQEETAEVETLVALRTELHEAQGEQPPEGVRALDAIKSDILACRDRLDTLTDQGSLVPYEVTPEVVSRVVSDWTGVPLGKIVRDEAALLKDFPAQMARFVKGQVHAVKAIGERIRTAKAGLGNPDAPIAVFLLVGPSGVGKTETATSVAELLFGGSQAMTTINMSEYQEKHSISRLIGSPPGYVGYGEGGVLTEAVRQRPYSVVLLDEIEKADLEVLNLFYNVFDKGVLNDSEGREIDFRNTVIFLTSNLATDEIMNAWRADPNVNPDAITETIRPILQKALKPALLGRMEVIPFLPIAPDVLKDIVKAKLGKVQRRLADSQSLQFDYDDDLVDFIASRCDAPDTGARNIDYVINRHVLPDMAQDVLSYLEAKDKVAAFRVRVNGEQIETQIST